MFLVTGWAKLSGVAITICNRQRVISLSGEKLLQIVRTLLGSLLLTWGHISACVIWGLATGWWPISENFLKPAALRGLQLQRYLTILCRGRTCTYQPAWICFASIIMSFTPNILDYSCFLLLNCVVCYFFQWVLKQSTTLCVRKVDVGQLLGAGTD